MGRRLAAADFDVPTNTATGEVRVRVIGVIENQAPTRALEATLPVGRRRRRDRPRQGRLPHRARRAPSRDREVVNAFVSGFGYDRPCAVASTVAHDSHQMIVVGTDKARHGAGRQPAAGGGRRHRRRQRGARAGPGGAAHRRADVDERAEIVAAKANRLVAAMRECGCTPEQRLHAAFAAGARRHPRIAHLGPGA